MPSFELTSPDGQKYRIEAPEGATQEDAYNMLQKQLQANNAGNTRGGDLLRGFGHGLASSIGLAGQPPAAASNWRTAGEYAGSAIPPTVAGALFGPESVAGKALFGAGTAAFQPAKDWKERAENMAWGGASAGTFGLLDKVPPGAKSALDHLAELGLGYTLGHHVEGIGRTGGAILGHYAGRDAEAVAKGMMGRRVGPYSIMSLILSNPGLASYLGVKASPYAEEAGQFVGQELGKPAQ